MRLVSLTLAAALIAMLCSAALWTASPAYARTVVVVKPPPVAVGVVKPVPPARRCPPGSHWSAPAKGCVKNSANCGPDRHWSTRHKACVPNCPAGHHWDMKVKRCLPNP